MSLKGRNIRRFGAGATHVLKSEMGQEDIFNR